MSIRPHVNRAYKHVFKCFNETAVYNPDSDNITFELFPFTLDKETDDGGTRYHEKFFMGRYCDVAAPDDSAIIEYLGERWRVSEVEREDINHFVLKCYEKERLRF